MLIVVSKVKKEFKDKGLRVPKNFISAMDALVGEMISLVITGEGSQSKIADLGPKTQQRCRGINAKYLPMALKRLEEKGLLNTGLLFKTAREIQNEVEDGKLKFEEVKE